MKLLLIFPCYNEQEVLPVTSVKIFEYFNYLIDKGFISKDSKICFVDDGSIDNTWSLISKFRDKKVLGIKLSKNFGHQKALLSALDTFKNNFDIYITLDVDLQDDLSVVTKMIEEYKKGFNIVYGVRNDRTTDSFFKRTTANIFYQLMKKLGVNMVNNHADFRLIDNEVLLHFLEFKESHLFLRAIFPLVGFKSTNVYYKRLQREAGETKYPLKKMLIFAWDGITSFSVTPLKMILLIGFFAIIISIILILWASYQLLTGHVITGWFSTITLIILFGGMQTFALGIIGEYIGKIFIQTKNRPRYIIEDIIKN